MRPVRRNQSLLAAASGRLLRNSANPLHPLAWQPQRASRLLLSPPFQLLFRTACEDLRAGHLSHAEQRLRNILVAYPNHADTLHLLGIVASQSGQLASGAELIMKAIALNPADSSYHCNLGNILQQLRRPQEAIAHYQQALQLRPNYAEAYMNFATALHSVGQPQQAIAYYKQALTIRPNYPQAYANLGHLHELQGNFDLAEPLYRSALALRPEFVEVHLNLGNLYQVRGEMTQAVECYERALALRPNFAEAHMNLANAYLTQGKLDAAVARYQQALALKPNSAEILMNYGTALRAQGNCEQALDYYQRSLALDPNYPQAQMNLALLHLLLGDYASGWHGYEGRWRVPQFSSPRRNFSPPQWRGEPLQGKRILLHGEQGFGDCIQFLRYLPLVRATGGQIILELPRGLQHLAAELPGVAELVVYGESLPGFDCHCPLMSLPLAFATTIETIPATVPYLSIPPEALQKASAITWPTEGLRVGLAWLGSPKHPKNRLRSIPLELLEPLTRFNNIHFYSLQMGASQQLTAAASPIVDLGQAIVGIENVAAVISHLDLVISVDTAIAHLAGALAKPVWLLLSSDADWRWLQARADSPWYPTARLFRQSIYGDWSDPLGRVASELASLTASRG